MLDHGNTTSFRYVPVWGPSCYPRQLRYIVLESVSGPFADQCPRIVSFISSISCKADYTFKLYHTGRGNVRYFSGQDLGYPKQHDERVPHSVKTRNYRTFLHDSLPSNNSRLTTPKTAVRLFVCSVRGYITRLTNSTILRQHHHLLSPATSAYNAHLRKCSCMYRLMRKIHSHEPFRFGLLILCGAMVPLKLSTSKP